MSRFCGRVGFAVLEESDQISREYYHERFYRGNYVTAAVRWQNQQEINDSLTMENRISFVSDGFCQKHLGAIRYVVIGEEKWAVTRVERQGRRLVLSIGGVYNGE